MRTLFAICVTVIVLVTTMWGQTAQNGAVALSDTDIQLLRSDLRTERDKIITDTMQFTPAESSAFWPVYQNYARDQQRIGDDLVKLIKDFSNHYDNMDDTNAKDMVPADAQH